MTRARALRLVETADLSPAEIYSLAWARMNEDVRFAVREEQVHYLQTIALSLEDDLASLLLLKKLKLADKLKADAAPPDLVGMNSYLEFRFGSGNRRFCRLLHRSVCATSFDLSIGSRLGAGVVGLSAGQRIQWPDADGNLRELHVIAVKNGDIGDGYAAGWPTGEDDDPPPAAA
jgi:regulator of nucleoside diphosphate kinase